MQDLINIGVILIWPLLCCFCYSRFDRVTATFIAIVGGFLLLPVKVGIDLPLLPTLDKNITSCIGALLGITLVKKDNFNWLGKDGIVTYLILAILSLTVINYFFNMQPMFNGVYWKEGITLYEAISACIRNYFAILPLVIAVNVIKSEGDVIKLHKLLVLALLIYLPLVLFEIRFSPQLHNYLYGFYPHSLKQQMREGGFRAMVFTGHGLLTANIYLAGFIALLILKHFKRYFISSAVNTFLIVVFFVMLVLLKSATATILALIATILLYLMSATPRSILLKGIVIFAIVYPLLVTLGLIPLDDIHGFLQGVLPPERIESLFFRLYNENLYVEYLGSYLFIGYGGLGRAIIPEVIVDGIWLVWTMRYGVIFWLVHVLLYAQYLFIKDNTNAKKVLSIFGVLPIVLLLDQMPNSSWSYPWAWLYAGALITLSQLYVKRNLNNS